jgi:hypothetical protein
MLGPVSHPATNGPRGRAGPGAESPRGRSGPAREPFAAPYDLVRLRAPEGPLRARIDPAGPGPGRPAKPAVASRSSQPGRRLRRFVARYGWRAWAIPLLTVATFVYVTDIATSDGDTGTGPAGPPGSTGAAPPARAAVPTAGAKIYVDAPPSGEPNRDLPFTTLPAGAPYSRQGAGRFDVVPGSSRVYGSGGPLRRYTVEVEIGVGIDRSAFAKAVELTLGDARSWGSGGRMSFQRVASGRVDFRIALASSMTVRRLCGYTLPFETSCYNGVLGRAVINDARWVRGAVAYGADLAAYQRYVVNHEVGHALGRGHEPCARAGALAPVMMQQTLGLETAGVGRCRRNPWPYP